jgi:hypothetical protein
MSDSADQGQPSTPAASRTTAQRAKGRKGVNLRRTDPDKPAQRPASMVAASKRNLEKANTAMKDPAVIARVQKRIAERTARKKARFLKAFARRAIKGIACKVAGVSLKTVRKWRDNNPAFAADYSRRSSWPSPRSTRS